MGLAITAAVVIIGIVAFACLAIAVLASSISDMLWTPPLAIVDVEDPWTHLLDDAVRHSPPVPRLSEAVSELRAHYAALLDQRRKLLHVLSTHERTPGDNTQGAFLQRQLVARESELDRMRARIRELHALVAIRRIGTSQRVLPTSEYMIGRMRAETEVELLSGARIEW